MWLWPLLRHSPLGFSLGLSSGDLFRTGERALPAVTGAGGGG